jgi:uncharacterized protein YbjQ (UPF0145 family)
MVVTGLSGNEMYCLHKKGYQAGDLVLGNSVFSMGLVGGIGSGFKTLMGGEVAQVTSVIHEGRQNSFTRMHDEAVKRGGVGVTGVTSELVQVGGNIEFLSIGSTVHAEGQSPKNEKLDFTTSSDGQALYCQLDAGFTPKKFVFGNVAYSIGVAGGLMGAFKGMARGEIKEYSDIFNTTRHLALERIGKEAREAGANAVVGINTSIVPFQGMQEMLMIGTASHHPALPEEYSKNPVTSDLTSEEMWNLVDMGYMPLRLVLGVSVYSLGLVGGISSAFKAMSRGEIPELTTLIYEARQNAIAKIAENARQAGAEDVVGIKTYVYQLGGGVIEFMAIGTAVRRMEGIKPQTEQLPPQAIIRDIDTFMNTAEMMLGSNLNQKKAG